VFSAAEADLALARGAALVAARTLDMSGPEIGGLTLRSPSRASVLVGVLAAAVVTFVVSLSAAIGLGLNQEEPAEQPENVSAAIEPERAAPPVRPLVKFPDMANVAAKTMKVAVPQAPPPVYAPPPAVAPPPVYQPPAPIYVPPPPKPRLRDRIIERIPIIGRFHEPGQ
jgi:hypothetical protein